jgi:hypothetical protein
MLDSLKERRLKVREKIENMIPYFVRDCKWRLGSVNVPITNI